MRTYLKYICAVLMIIGISAHAWGAKILQFDFSETISGWPTASGGSATTKTYTLVNDYTFSLGSNVYFGTYDDTYYLMLRNTTYLGLPAISGYKLTGVEISNSSGCSTSTKVAVCTNTSGTAVSGGSSKTFSTTGSTYTYSLSGTSANTVYYLYITAANCQIVNLTLTYTATSACTVTFNAGTGTSTSSLTEGSAGSGIVLPTATPASDCSSEYEFWGWTTEACEDETEEPLTMYFAGNKFYPESNCTLYAVYVSGKSATLDYVAISRGAEIKSGEQYIIEAYDGEGDYALKADVISTNYLDQKDISSYLSSDIYSEDPADNTIIWTITQEANETNVSLYNASSSKYLWINSSSYIGLNASKQTFTIAYEDHGESYLGSFSLKNSNSKYVYYDDENDWFTSSTSSDRNLYLYRRLYSGTFNTSPVCCDKMVELSEGEENYAEFLEFSSFNQPTCSSTAADRQVTMTVEPNVGYELTSSARLEWLAVTGTFDENSPTYISGPTDNGDGTYNFVYQFTQNDNGGGFFSVTASPRNYTLSFNSNGGSGAMDDEVRTYATTAALPPCTFTRPEGKVFDHWDTADDGSGDDYDPGDDYTIGAGNATLYAIWRDAVYDNYRFSCAEIEFTGAEDALVMVTSSANNKVRSQEAFHVTGSGLTASTALTFSSSSDKFEFKTASGGAVTTDANGDIDADVYAFYTPANGDTNDGLDEPTTLKASMTGATNSKRRIASLNYGKGFTTTLKGRHLPTDFVIAAKVDDKWYALPADKTTGTHDPIEIIVDNATTPTQVLTPDVNVYTLYGQTNKIIGDGYGQYIKLAMHGQSNAPLAGQTSGNTGIGKSLGTVITNDQDENYWWALTQTNSSVSSSADAKYNMTVANGNPKDLKIWFNAGGAGVPKWGLYSTATNMVDEIRLIPWYGTPIEVTVSEWGEHGVIAKPATPSDVSSVSSAEMNIDKNTPQTASVTAINGNIGSVNRVRVADVGSDLSVGVAANQGKNLYIHWKNSEGTEIGVSQIEIPTVVAANANVSALSDKTEVHVLPGITLTGNETTTIDELHIYPGATLNVSTGTLTATTLRLRNGWTRAGSTQYNTARVYIADDAALTKTTASMDYDIYNSAEGRHYYPLAVPFETAVSSIDYADTYLAVFSNYGASGQYVIKEYDGANRAINGEDRENNWDAVSSSANLTPGKGYIMTAVPVKGEAIIRVPLVYNDAWTSDGEKGTANYDAADHTKNVIAVTAHSGAAATAHNRHKGWNMLGVPFMSCYGNVDDIYSAGGSATLINGELVVNTSLDQNMGYQSTTIPYVSVPSHNFAEYIQTDISEAELRPGWSFLVQVNENGNLTFAVGNQQADDDSPIYAPKRTTEDDVVVKTGIILSGADASDKTTILISNQYSCSEYEIGADLEKMFGSGYTLAVYSLSGSTRLAYNAMSPTDAQMAIPIGYRAPADGEYTFSLNPKYADAPLERVDLIDYQLGTLTNLLTSSYTFQTGQTQNDTRFALNIVKQKETPTDVGNVEGMNGERMNVYKVLINEQMYIIQGDKMYDATGKRVREINK